MINNILKILAAISILILLSLNTFALIDHYKIKQSLQMCEDAVPYDPIIKMRLDREIMGNYNEF